MDHLNIDQVIPKKSRTVTLFDKEWDVSLVPSYVTLRYYHTIQVAINTADAVNKLREETKGETDSAKQEITQKKIIELETNANDTMQEAYELTAKVFEANGNPIDIEQLRQLDERQFSMLYKHVIMGTNPEKKTYPLMM
jgi:hypothetical protein